MKIMYIGKKPGIRLTFTWLSAVIMMVPFKEVEVSDADGLRLVNDYPETIVEFTPDPLEQFIAENTPAESFDIDAQPPTEPAPMAAMATDIDEIEFEVKDGKYLCPFCEKEYAATDNGKPWMIKHLEKSHAALWAKALAEKRTATPSDDAFSEAGAD